MNHGVVMFARHDMPHAAIWQMAMGRGQFVAIYSSTSMEGSTDWSSARVPTTGAPLRFPPTPDLGGNYNDYARYEPAYDEQFCRMCDRCSGYGGHRTVVLPATASDQEAMRLLGKLDSLWGEIWAYYHERFYVIRRENLRKPKKSKYRLADLMKPIQLNDRWAYLLGFCRAGDDIVVFLSDSQSDVEGIFGSINTGRPIIRQADWLEHYGVIEKW